MKDHDPTYRPRCSSSALKMKGISAKMPVAKITLLDTIARTRFGNNRSKAMEAAIDALVREDSRRQKKKKPTKKETVKS